MKISVDEKVFKRFPGLNIGIIKIKALDNSARNTEIEKLLSDIESYCRDTYLLESYTKLPSITNWKKVYKFSRKNYSAMEPLLYDVLTGKSIPRTNNLANLYTYYMLKSMIPVGGDDLDKVEGDIRLKIAEGHETLETTDGVEHPDEGELIYEDSNEVLARRFGWKQSKKTKINHYTKKAVLYLDGLPPIGLDELKAAMIELKELITTYCKADIMMSVLSKDKPETVL